ncbi:inorganic phosphate transporter [Candidatus Saccharibacteria bacterium]|nr:inorganic phosphate transporter [Candidatus Saccharibacteria bacterium]
MEELLIIIVVLALFFDFTNGFHDTANAIATSVSTKALPPKVAVIWAAILNFLGAFVSLKVAATVAKGVVATQFVTLEVVLAGIVGAIIWNLFTWRIGMPTSSSHALIGGVAGAAIAGFGMEAIKWQGLQQKVIIPSLVAPFLGLLIALLIMLFISRLTRGKNEEKTESIFRRLQVASASFVAFTHGTNDAQKTMGIIALALIAANPGREFDVPIWVIFSSALFMALGTYVGGWRIIKTLGERIVDLKPKQGFAAETATASILWTTAHFGFPVSTTHTISSSIVGSGIARKPSKINWKIVRSILIAWLFTLPCAALVGASMKYITDLPAGDFVVFALAVALSASIIFTRHWKRESFVQVLARLLPIDRSSRRSLKV